MKNDNRTRAIAYRKLLALWFRAEGIPVHARPYVIRQRQQAEGDNEQGHLRGLPDVLINSHVEKEFLVAEQVDRCRADAETGGKSLAFAVQKRSGRDVDDSLVFCDLRTLREVITRLQAAE